METCTLSPHKSVSFLEIDPVVATFAPTLYSCCFLYLDAVGYVTKPVHCLTLSRGGRADSDFGAVKGEHKKTLFAYQYKKSHKRNTYGRQCY